MVYRKISSDMKERALQLLDEGWDMEDVAAVLGMSSKSIRRWSDNHDIHGRVEPSVLQGCPQILNSQMLSDLHDLIRENPNPTLFLDEIGEWLALYQDQPISTTALLDNLRELGLTHKILQRAAAEHDDGARADWLIHITSNYTACQMVFVDASSKDGRTILRKYERALSGTDPSQELSFNRDIRFNILPALTLDGYIAVRAVEGSIDDSEFFDFVVNDVLPCMNPFPEPNSIMIVDNCSTHQSNAVREVVEAAGCLYIFLPPNSPDYSPIEESFSCVKSHLRRNWQYFQASQYPERDLTEACFVAVTADKAQGWFHDCGYL